MTLLEVGPDFKIQLNKDWLLTIPQFRKLIQRDKGSPGDYDGRRKFRAIRELTFIYHISDPRSPLENAEELERREKSLQYAELQEKDIDQDILAALDEYDYLLSISVPTLRLLRASKGTLDKLVTHFDTIDFSKVDKMGRTIHSPADHIKNVGGLSKLHKEIQAFEEIVLSELKQQKQARGKAELSDREQFGQRRKWTEGEFNPHNPANEQVNEQIGQTNKEISGEPKATSKNRSGAPENRLKDPDWEGNTIQLVTVPNNSPDYVRMIERMNTLLEEPAESMTKEEWEENNNGLS